MDRRNFIKSCLGSAAVLGSGLPVRHARAAVSGSDLKFVFVFNSGGWDPTRVFATEFSNRNVAMEAGADLSTRGGLGWVSHPDRPSVDAFFAAHADRVLLSNGMLVRSIAHEICTMIAMTGSTSGFAPDWPAIIAAAASDRYTLPHLVLGGPSFPGELGVAVARSGNNGQLEGLLSGGIIDRSDMPVSGLSQPAQGTIDRYLLRRAAARAASGTGAPDNAMVTALSDAMQKAVALKDYRYVMDFTGGTDLSSQAAVAADALQVGLSRCVSLSYTANWDSHVENDTTQSPLFEGLFLGLGQLMSLLVSTPGSSGGTLADETVVVVLSEMGRTPELNPANGKDHWPYTSAMIVGPNFTTGRVVGGFDDGYYGKNIDLGTGELDEGGRILSAEALGATLLAAADVDPGEYIMDADPITGLLA